MKKSLVALVLAASFSLSHAADAGVNLGNAASMGDLSFIDKALANGVSINALDTHGFTPLQMAAWHGQDKLVAALLDRGADINGANQRGETALMTASWQGHESTVRLLLSRGANTNNADMQWNALHYTAFAGHDKIATLLLASGADVNLRTTNGSSALMMTAREHHPEITKILLAAGARTDIKNDWGDDVIAWAVKNRNFDIAKIIDKGVDIAQLEAIAARTEPVTKSIAMVGGMPASAEMIAKMENALRNGGTAYNVMPPRSFDGPLVTRSRAKAPEKLVTRSGERAIIEFSTPARHDVVLGL